MISALDNHLLRAYLDGEMDDAAAEAFEVLMIERPELAEFVDADTALRIGLAAAPTAARHSEPVIDPVVRALPLRKPAPAWIPLAAAACTALAIGLVLGRSWSPAPAGLAPTTLLSVDRLRSSVAVAPTLRLPAAGLVVLSVPAVVEAGCTPTVRVVQAGNVLEAQVAPDDSGFANVSLAATRLAPGRAEVSVACGSRRLAEYPVEFVR
jgi:anti-sigma factor RsiW